MNQLSIFQDPVYSEFERRALNMAQRRGHYSARCIVEGIRYDTDLMSRDKQFKINNNTVPGFARRWMRDHGHDYPNFFQIRDSLGRDA